MNDIITPTYPRFTTVFHREKHENGEVILEQDVPRGDPFAAGEIYFPWTGPVAEVQQVLQIRVHLRGAEGVDHAFDNLEALFNENFPRDKKTVVDMMVAMQRKAMLAQGARGMPPLHADGPGRRKG